jgi:hypothetical protein
MLSTTFWRVDKNIILLYWSQGVASLNLSSMSSGQFYKQFTVVIFCQGLVSYVCMHPCSMQTSKQEAGNINWSRGISTVDLLIKVSCFVKKVNNVRNIKRIWSKLLSTREVYCTQPSLSGSVPCRNRCFKIWENLNIFLS